MKQSSDVMGEGLSVLAGLLDTLQLCTIDEGRMPQAKPFPISSHFLAAAHATYDPVRAKSSQ